MASKIISFGFRHGKPDLNLDEIIFDVRMILRRNPYHDRRLRRLRGDHKDVIKDILKTPRFDKKYAELKLMVDGCDSVVYLGCTGGHHRSVYLADRLGRELGVPVEHRDYHKK